MKALFVVISLIVASAAHAQEKSKPVQVCTGECQKPPTEKPKPAGWLGFGW